MSTDYALACGPHATPEEGRCAMEWVSHLAGEPHSDAPTCVSPVLRAFCTALNDGLADAPRQRLRPYLARTIGTADDGLDEPRAWMAMDWLIRTYTPAWLSLAGYGDEATLSELQESAFALLDLMLPNVPLAPPVAHDTEQLSGRVWSWQRHSITNGR